jgi:hypothetical protein
MEKTVQQLIEERDRLAQWAISLEGQPGQDAVLHAIDEMLIEYEQKIEEAE